MTGKSASAHAAQPADPESLELAPGTEHENLEGWVPSMASERDIFDALEKAFDYRGDVTITRKDGALVEGYIFDRHAGASLADSYVRLFPKDSPEKASIAYSEIAALAFTGKDRAAGASWEAWVKKWKEKKSGS
jgi:hypothetical protein